MKVDLDIFTAFCITLANLDWTYEYSDDHRVWQKGKARMDHVKSIAANNPMLGRVFRAYTDSFALNDYAEAEAFRKEAIAKLRQQLIEPQPMAA